MLSIRTRRIRPIMLLSACVIGLMAVTASAATLPRLTYAAKLKGGASVKFTLARGHKLIDSYQILSATGKQKRNGKAIAHGTCQFEGRGAKGIFKPVTVSKTGKFTYKLGSAFKLTAKIKGRKATGTFTFSDPAAGSTPACSTGVVHFTAKA